MIIALLVQGVTIILQNVCINVSLYKRPKLREF